MYNTIDLDKIDINLVPPLEEPDRQYYFMEKCRKLGSLDRKMGGSQQLVYKHLAAK